MVGLDEVAELYVVYGYGVDSWERRLAPAEGNLPPDAPQPPDGRYLPGGRFAALWAQAVSYTHLTLPTGELG